MQSLGLTVGFDYTGVQSGGKNKENKKGKMMLQSKKE